MDKNVADKKTKSKTKSIEVVLMMHNIRSVYNTGAIFRTADAIGISKIYLSGFTPTPLDRFGRKRKDFHKCALGAEESVSWEKVEDVLGLIKDLKIKGFKIVGLEQDKKSIDYKKLAEDLSIKKEQNKKIAIILGSEVGGMDQELLRMCDVVAEIPMKGQKDSLNLSVSTGIFLYRLFDK